MCYTDINSRFILVIKDLIWDDWNRDHIARHNVVPEEVEQVCNSKFKAIKSYRKKTVIKGKTRTNRSLYVVLSPDDEDLNPYGEGIYYPITAFE